MSKKNRQDNPVVLVLFWLLGLLLAVFAALASLVIFLGWLACETKYRNHPRSPGEAGVLLDEEEREELTDIGSHIRRIEARLAQIEVEGQHLRRRKDGMFHAGSSLGIQFNSEITGLASDLSDSQAIRHELLARPDERLRNWAELVYRLIAFRWAVTVYLVSFLYSVLATPRSVIYMNQMIAQWLSGYMPDLSMPIYGGMALASIVASCVGGAAYLCYSRLIYRHYTEQISSHWAPRAL